MKDKLLKTGHKRGYYRLKAFFTVGLFSLAAIVVSAVPIGIGLKIAEAEAQASELPDKAEDSASSSASALLTF